MTWHTRFVLSVIAIGLWAGHGVAQQAEQFDPVGLFLTWQRDPTTTMTIDWHTVPEQGERPSVVQYKPVGGEQWQEAEGASHPFPHSDRSIHRVELTGLEPASTYRIRFGEDSKAYQFRTMPADLSEPLRFISGGDTGQTERFHRVNEVAAGFDPDFIVWGGDLAYANGDPRRVTRWYSWFDGIKSDLIREDGRIIPIVVAIGNHEVWHHSRVGDDISEEDAQRFIEEHGLEDRHATFFYDLFAFPGSPTYNVLDFGQYMSLVILDSNHQASVDGDQAEWLARTLRERQGRPHIFPVYHVPAYPSVRSFHGGTSRRIRENWVPLFEQYGVRVSFEHHDHAYKRTYPVRGEQRHPNGIVFLGDGSWGAGMREPLSRAGDDPVDWYLARATNDAHCIVVTLHGPHQHYLMLNQYGEVIDEYPQTPRRSSVD